MLNLRDKTQPNKIYRLQELRHNNNKVEYLGKTYIIPQSLTLFCKGVGFSRHIALDVNEALINRGDNPGMMEIKAINAYRFAITKNQVMLSHCLVVTSKTPDGTGLGEILCKTDVGAFSSVDVLKDFCKRHKLNLIN